jgi:hypothetical protein
MARYVDEFAVRHPCRRFAAVALLLVATVHAKEPPSPKAGAIPLELEQIAEAAGPKLRLSDAPLDLAGNQVRFTAQVADLGKTAAGGLHHLADGGDRLLPAPRPARQARASRPLPDVGR